MKRLAKSDNSSEQDVLLCLKSTGTGKAMAEEKLFLKYAYLIAAGTRDHGLCEDDAFSAYSDAVLDVINSINMNVFEGRSSLKTYLYRIFYNKCIDLARKKSAKKNRVFETVSLDPFVTSISDDTKTIIEKMDEHSDMFVLNQKLEQLGSLHRKLLFLSMVGYTDSEISSLVNLKSMAVVKVTRLRCIKKLRCMLN